MGYDYDLVVIGSGPAGEKGAAQAAYFGKRVCIIERSAELGGACANTGTLPSKTLRETALYLSGLRQREIYGVEYMRSVQGVSVAEFMRHKEFVTQRERERIKRNLEKHKVEVVHGAAGFVDPHAVKVDLLGGGARTVTGDVVLIATGSSPHRPKEVPFEDPRVDDSDEILSLDSMPETLVVLGGGVIGSEYASVFAALGCKVTLVEGRDRLLGFLDFELSDRLTDAFRKLGIDVVLSDQAVKIEHPEGDALHLRTTLKSGRVIISDRLLSAAGRGSNIAGLNLAAAGVETAERGKIKVSESFQTTSPRIYAAGDVIGFPALASTSMEQGRVAMCHAFDFKYKTRVAATFPYGLYTIPEVSSVGQTEEELKKAGVDYEVGRASYVDNARAQIVNDPHGMVKLLFDATTRKLYGIHVLGERSTEFVHVGQAVMALGGTLDYFIDNVFNYPTLSELFKYAAYDGLGRLARRTSA